MKLPFLFVAALYALMPAPVTLFIRPTFSMAPASFQATILIERHDGNRLLKVEYDGPEYKSSEYQLDGATSKRAFQPRVWELRSAGEYLATATLTRIVEGKEKKLVA